MILTWNRGEFRQLSPHFTSTEFTCQCNECISQQVDSSLLDALEAFRHDLATELGTETSIQITSGYRCRAHQAELSQDPGIETVATGNLSQHELGLAADHRPYKLGIMDRYLAVAERHFKAIGVAHTWLHTDMRADKVRRWTYK